MATRYYAWTADVQVHGDGRFRAQGESSSPKPATEGVLRAAAARDVAVKQNVSPNDVYIVDFIYTELS
ncbi:hypothetical protein ACXZ65_34345 [Streptomyces aculeolatus]